MIIEGDYLETQWAMWPGLTATFWALKFLCPQSGSLPFPLSTREGLGVLHCIFLGFSWAGLLKNNRKPIHEIEPKYHQARASLMAQMVKHLSAVQETKFNPWVGTIPWRRKWQPTPVLLPGKSHGWRSLVGYSPWGCKESDMTEQLHFHFHHQVVYYIENYGCYCLGLTWIVNSTNIHGLPTMCLKIQK